MKNIENPFKKTLKKLKLSNFGVGTYCCPNPPDDDHHTKTAFIDGDRFYRPN